MTSAVGVLFTMWSTACMPGDRCGSAAAARSGGVGCAPARASACCASGPIGGPSRRSARTMMQERRKLSRTISAVCSVSCSATIMASGNLSLRSARSRNLRQLRLHRLPARASRAAGCFSGAPDRGHTRRILVVGRPLEQPVHDQPDDNLDLRAFSSKAFSENPARAPWALARFLFCGGSHRDGRERARAPRGR